MNRKHQACTFAGRCAKIESPQSGGRVVPRRDRSEQPIPRRIMTQVETKEQRHARLAMAAARRIPASKNQARTVGTWAHHMKSYLEA